MRRNVVASFLDPAEARRAMIELARTGINAAVRPESEEPASRMAQQRQEAEAMVVGPGVAVPGPSARAAVAGSLWGAIAGAIAGLLIGAIASGGRGIAMLIAVVCGATGGAVFGGFWAGAARADEEANKDELVERRALAVSVPVADRAETIRVVRTLKEHSPEHVGVVDEDGRPLDDEADEALWVREA